MLRLLVLSVFLSFHPVHVSITSIEYAKEVSAFRVFMRMYFDDFLLDSRSDTIGFEQLKKQFSAPVPSSKDLVSSYIREKLVIVADNQPLSARLKDIKLSDNEINIYIEYPVGKKPDKVLVKNYLLTSMYPDQSNMVILKINDFEEGAKLSSELTERTFVIE